MPIAMGSNVVSVMIAIISEGKLSKYLNVRVFIAITMAALSSLCLLY